MPLHSRRRFLRAAALLTAGSLAGCPGLGSTGSDTPANDDPDSTETTATAERATPTNTATPTETPTATETPTDTATGTPADTPTPRPRIGGTPDPRPDTVWPLPDRSVANDAYDEDGPGFDEPPSVAWRAAARRPASESDIYDPVLEQAVVADGRVFAVNALYFGPQVELPGAQLLRAFDVASGEELWTHTVRDEEDGVPVPTGPVVGDGVVFFGTGETLHEVDPASGESVRTHSLPGAVETITPAGDRTYVVADDTVLVLGPDGDTEWSTAIPAHVGTRPALGPDRLYVGASSKQLYALDPATGDVIWRRTVGHDGGDGGWAVYDVVAFATGVVVRRANETLYAYDDAGERVWYADGGYRSVATDGSRLYCGREAGSLRALDVATGEVRWKRDWNGDGNVGRPVVADGRLYAANVVRPGPMQPLPGRQPLLAADAATGEKLWTHEIVGEDEGVERPVTPAVGDGAVLFGAGERVRALDPVDGSLIWTRTLPDGLDAVYATGERSYAVVAGTLHALDATGGTAWTADTDGPVGTLPARGPDRLYLVTGTGRLSAHDPETGEVAWTETFDGDGDGVSTGYGVLAAERGVFVRTGGDVVAFADDGSRVWRVDGYVTGLATDGRTLYGGTRSGTVRALDAATGEEVRAVDPDGVLQVSGGPVLADGVLYLVGDGDRLLAVRTDDGSTLWNAAVSLSGLALTSDTLYGSEGEGGGVVALR